MVGDNGLGQEKRQLNCPVDLSFDSEENLHVADRGNNRIEKFERERIQVVEEYE